ncbi:hypothetical protein [Burkholderia plantarii]|uniref:hypothetical protein n=1 Tax=Burkholderia plantarii TaxID=41899 RepID=UPI00130E712D|nr:hypothetical protein [Burkholderia plantarii]
MTMIPGSVRDSTRTARDGRAAMTLSPAAPGGSPHASSLAATTNRPERTARHFIVSGSCPPGLGVSPPPPDTAGAAPSRRPTADVAAGRGQAMLAKSLVFRRNACKWVCWIWTALPVK